MNACKWYPTAEPGAHQVLDARNRGSARPPPPWDALRLGSPDARYSSTLATLGRSIADLSELRAQAALTQKVNQVALLSR